MSGQPELVDVHTVCGKVVTRPDKRGNRCCIHCDRDNVTSAEVVSVPRAEDYRMQNATTHIE